MLELLCQFERVATRFDGFALAISGIICVLVGLFLWLGGVGHRISLAVVLGAAAGVLCVFFLGGWSITAAAIAASAGAAAALLASRIFTAILAGALGAALSFAFVISPYLAGTESFRYRIPDEGQRLDFAETIEAAKAFGSYAAETLKGGCDEMAVYKWFIPPVIGLMLLSGGFLVKRTTWALCCSVLGTFFVLAGMILLFLFEGSKPISSIAENQLFYRAAAAAMIAIGVLAQVLLSHREYGRRPRLRIVKKAEPEKSQAGESN